MVESEDEDEKADQKTRTHPRRGARPTGTSALPSFGWLSGKL